MIFLIPSKLLIITLRLPGELEGSTPGEREKERERERERETEGERERERESYSQILASAGLSSTQLLFWFGVFSKASLKAFN